jgi:PAS domain S-box-containing protein
MPETREFEALFTAALEAVVVVDDERRVLAANPATSRLLGRTGAELLGHRLDEFVASSAREIMPIWQAFLDSGSRIGALRIVRGGGDTRDVEYTATANFVPGRHLAVLRDVTDRKRLEAERAALLVHDQARLREAETLLAVSRALSATLDPTETMRRVAREIALAVGADTVGAYLADVQHEQLRPIAGYRVPKHLLDNFIRYPIPIRNHPAIEEAWVSRHAVWTDDMAGDPRVDRVSLDRFPHQTDLFVPIRIKDAPAGGFFVIWWTERRRVTPGEMRLLDAISDLAGIFLDNAQLYRDVSEANRTKDVFLATLSHELRNPLAAISAAATALGQPALGDQSAGRLRRIIDRQTRHLSRLLDDLLDVARVTADKINLRRRPVDLCELANTCVQSLRDSDRVSGHRITFSGAPAVVNADPTRIEQILTNLLDNAVKYTPAGGCIDVDVCVEPCEAVLRVTDAGTGIAPDMLPRIFDLFAQGKAGDDRTAGLGVGLTLARRLVELHGGSIAASSDGIGTGSRFTVRLPLAQDQAVPIAPPRFPARPLPRRLLVIEDNDDAREAVRTLLEVLGHQVTVAADGEQGLALAMASQPDAVLIDLGLPTLDGFQVAAALRATPEGQRMRLIALTGYGQPQDRDRTRAAGFDVHIVKPVEESTLSRAIAGDGD